MLAAFPRGSGPMNDSDLLRRRARALGPAYRLFYERPLHLVRGEGAWLFDADGRRYLDGYNNVASVGHAHPAVLEALAFTPLHRDEIIREIDAPIGQVADALLDLVLSGEAEEHAGARFSLRAPD